ncbi:unnamed protein product [Prunus armeniaca]
MAMEWLVANCSRNSKTSKQILKLHWSPPCAGCFKINADGSCMGEMGSISVGGIIRDSTGGWIKGFVTNLRCDKILEAELWGVFRCLLLTWNEDIRRIKVECDSFTDVSLINGETRPSHPLSSLIHNCKDMLLCDWECSISHIYREQNIDAAIWLIWVKVPIWVIMLLIFPLLLLYGQTIMRGKL